MSFSEVLREQLEADGGVVLRLSIFQRIEASAASSEGQPFGLYRRIQARSRMILAAARAFGRRTNEEEEE